MPAITATDSTPRIIAGFGVERECPYFKVALTTGVVRSRSKPRTKGRFLQSIQK